MSEESYPGELDDLRAIIMLVCYPERQSAETLLRIKEWIARLTSEEEDARAEDCRVLIGGECDTPSDAIERLRAADEYAETRIRELEAEVRTLRNAGVAMAERIERLTTKQ